MAQGQALCRFSHVKTVGYLRLPTRQAGYFSQAVGKSPWALAGRYGLEPRTMRAADRPQTGLSAVTGVKVATARRQMRTERNSGRSADHPVATLHFSAGISASPHRDSPANTPALSSPDGTCPMPAVHTATASEAETHLTFETAAEHATACVPLAGRLQRVSGIRALLVGGRRSRDADGNGGRTRPVAWGSHAPDGRARAACRDPDRHRSRRGRSAVRLVALERRRDWRWRWASRSLPRAQLRRLPP